MSIRGYRDFVLYTERVDTDNQNGRPRRFRLRVFDSPIGEGEHSEEVTIDDWEQLDRWNAELAARQLNKADLARFGGRLRELILPEYALQLYRASRNNLAGDEGLRVRLRVPDELACLPWEYALVKLHDGEIAPDDYWALDRQVSIVRHQEISIPAVEFCSNPERRVIVALASPEPYEDYPRLDLAGEEQAIRNGLHQVAGLSVQYIPDFEQGGQAERANEQTIENALQHPADVFHFTGHGHFDPAEHCGKIFLSERNNTAQPVRADALSRLLGSGQIRLAVLGSCETGERDMYLRWSCIATALLRGGIPAVVAMQYTVEDQLAKEFTRTLYENLVRGGAIDEAVAQARWVMHNRDGSRRDWGAPVLYLRNSGGNIFPPVTDESARRKAEQACERNSTLAEISLRWTHAAELASPAQQAVLRQGGDHLDLTPADAVLLLRSAVEFDQPTDCWISQLRKDKGKWLQQVEDGTVLPDREETGLALKHLGLDDPSANDRPELISRLAWSAARSDDVLIGQTSALALLALNPGQVIAKVQEALTQGIANLAERGQRRAALLGILAEENPSIAERLPRDLEHFQDRVPVWWWRARKHVYRNRALLSGWIWGGALGAAFALGLFRAFLAVFNALPVGTEFAVNSLWGFLLGLGLVLGIVLGRPLLLQDFGEPEPAKDGRAARLSVLLGGLGFCLANTLVVMLNDTAVSGSTFVLYLIASFVIGIALSLGLLHQPRAGWRLGVGGWLKRLIPVAVILAIAQLPALCEMALLPGGRPWIDTSLWISTSVIEYSQRFSFLYSRYPFMESMLAQAVPAQGARCCFSQGGSLFSACFAQWLTVLDAALVGLVLTVGITAGLHFSQTWLGNLWLRFKARLDIKR